MKARAGDVYTVFNNYLGRYTACQVAYIAPPDAVIKQPGAVILSLDWVGNAPLGWGAKFGPEGSSIIGSPSGNPE